MSLYGLGAYHSSTPQDRFSSFDRHVKPDGHEKTSAQKIQGSGRGVRAVTEFYSSQKFAFEFTSKDGDTVSFSYESVEYHKAMLQIDGKGSKEDLKELAALIKEEYSRMKKELVHSFIRSTGGEIKESQKTEKAKKLEVPEYWNAENTSQRIVDFSVAFFGAFKGEGEEFLDKIRSAIEDGFKQAREILGNLPDEVSGLINDTYDLVMKKLDSWAVGQGIQVQKDAAA